MLMAFRRTSPAEYTVSRVPSNLDEARTLFIAIRVQGSTRKRHRRWAFDESYDDILAPDRLSRLIARNVLGLIINNVVSPLKRVLSGDFSPPRFVTGWNWLGFGKAMGKWSTKSSQSILIGTYFPNP